MLDYRRSQYGDHPTDECRRARADYRAGLSDDAAGFHAGWGICDGRVAVPEWMRRAMARELPAKVTVAR